MEEFDDWRIKIPFVDANGRGGRLVSIICCPEDRTCMHARCQQNGDRVCPDCEVPICNDCKKSLQAEVNVFESIRRKPPNRALSNELMVFYAPKTMYNV